MWSESEGASLPLEPPSLSLGTRATNEVKYYLLVGTEVPYSDLSASIIMILAQWCSVFSIYSTCSWPCRLEHPKGNKTAGTSSILLDNTRVLSSVLVFSLRLAIAARAILATD